MHLTPRPFAARTGARSALTGLYARVGVETSVDGADPHRLVAMLFDGVIESIAQARGALRDGNVAAKGQAIGRAVRIVSEGLRAALNLNADGTLARDMDALYEYIALRLTHANLHADERALDECQRLIEPLRSAWMQIGSSVAAPAAA
jgi:flagellar protein FliS